MRKIMYRILPLIILYFVLIIIFLGNSNYEAMITITATIPLIIYIFNKDAKTEKLLRYILYLFSLGLFVYLIILFNTDYYWFSFCMRHFNNATIWEVLKWNWFFIQDLKYLIYIGIVFLAINYKKVTKNN